MLLGVHCSIAGGYENAIKEAEELGIDTFQIFTKNQRQWKERIVTEEEGISFNHLQKDSSIKIGLSHTTYLINLASDNEDTRKNSIIALGAELLRCQKLGLHYAVLHPGANKTLKEIDAIARIAEGLELVFKYTPGNTVKILLENTAGQGSSIGWKFEHIKDIIQLSTPDRLGMCLDTCHAFAAGYDIRSQTGLESMIAEIDKSIGLKKLYAIHINDSKGALGSRIDRHAHIGQGYIGLDAFRYIMRQFSYIPKILETSKENNMDRKNLELLRSLLQ